MEKAVLGILHGDCRQWVTAVPLAHQQPGGIRVDNRITIDPQVCHGQACVKGTRIPVHQILLMLASGDTIEDLLREYPSVTRQDILACFGYAALLAEEQGTPLEALSAEGGEDSEGRA